MTPNTEAIRALAETGDLIAYFGYGSLVNPATHRTPVVGYTTARLKGWKRSWVPRPDWDDALPIALLSASPDGSDDWLDGLLVFDTVTSLPSLDEREAGYRRVQVSADAVAVSSFLPRGTPIYVYEALPIKTSENGPGAILQSYLDAVLQGYAHMHGDAAIAGFVDETGNFDTPVLKDRDTPLYPRAVTLHDHERALIDAATAHLNWIDALERCAQM
ncbi:MAG: gamma-glutamylcyclotransferase family protein [Pseudomonadota bacterium]